MTPRSTRRYRVLVAHNFYKEAGGEDAVFAAEVELLRRYGHTVIEFTKDNEEINGRNQVAVGLNAAWSRTTRRQLSSILATARPDLVHFHNTFPLISPAAYYACKAANVPVVQTLHNYRMWCPAAIHFRDGAVCEECSGHAVPWSAVRHGCYRGSRLASAAAAVTSVSQRLNGIRNHGVDTYIALTEFARNKFIAAGLPANRIVVKPNFVDPDPGPGSHYGGYALFVGRLAPEKGIETILAAWRRPELEIPLIIVGDGPLAERVREETACNPRVSWRGWQGAAAVRDLVGAAAFLVVASEWYETFGRVVIEAYSRGTPVVAANIGAVGELVRHGETGLTFCPGDAEGLATNAQWLSARPDARRQMGAAARISYLENYTADRNLKLLLDIYDGVVQARAPGAIDHDRVLRPITSPDSELRGNH